MGLAKVWTWRDIGSSRVEEKDVKLTASCMIRGQEVEGEEVVVEVRRKAIRARVRGK